MYTEIIKKLGATSLEDNFNSDNNIKEIEKRFEFKFPKNYVELLKNFRTSIIFNNGVFYKPLVCSPACNKDGFQNLDILFGLNGKHNLIDENLNYSEIIPEGYIAIGESDGVDLLLLNSKNSSVYFLDHEAQTYDSMLFKISDNIDNFISNLCSNSAEDNIEKKSDEDLGIVTANLSSLDAFVAQNKKLMNSLRKSK